MSHTVSKACAITFGQKSKRMPAARNAIEIGFNALRGSIEQRYADLAIMQEIATVAQDAASFHVHWGAARIIETPG